MNRGIFGFRMSSIYLQDSKELEREANEGRKIKKNSRDSERVKGEILQF